MTSYEEAIMKIVKAQEAIIGPLAYGQAISVAGIFIENNKIILKGNGKELLGKLVNKYSEFFGQASIEVCKEAINSINPHPTPEDLPDILK